MTRPPMHLYFIRHGQSTNNDLPLGRELERDPDPALTPVGRRQARAVARRLRTRVRCQDEPGPPMSCLLDRCGLTTVYCSPMRRALETAVPIGAAIGLKPVPHRDLHEIGGLWRERARTGRRIGLPGSTWECLREAYPGVLVPADARGAWYGGPPETARASYRRAGRVLEWLLARHGLRHEGVAVVSHRGFYNVLMLALLGLALPRAGVPLSFQLHNAAVTRIDLAPERFTVAYQNDVSHLREELLTSFRPGTPLRAG